MELNKNIQVAGAELARAKVAEEEEVDPLDAFMAGLEEAPPPRAATPAAEVHLLSPTQPRVVDLPEGLIHVFSMYLCLIMHQSVLAFAKKYYR